MIPLQNLHTHCTFCDGKDEPEEVVKEAIRLGMSSLGFSSHSFTGNPKVDGMQDERGYIDCIRALKEKYRDRIRIFLGVERDCFTEILGLESEYDYKIGSVHYLKIKGEYEAVDWSKDRLKNTCEKCFGGDMTRLCEAYFELESKVVEMADCNIVGHFDLITLFSGMDDREDRRFIDAEMAALDELLKTDTLFDVNTGAMARGYRTGRDPSENCLRRIREKNGRVIISSDCHDRSKLLYGFDVAAELIKRYGFKEVYILTDGGFEPVGL